MATIDGVREQAGPSRLGAIAVPSGALRAPNFASGLGLVSLFAGTLLLAAFLLFSVQPMFTKRVMPLLGSTPAVWSIAMVVFQTLLLAGYAYAHAITRYLSPKSGAFLHGIVLLLGFSALPIAVASGFETPPPETEAPWLIGLFLASIGLPFFALSASAPLVQAWFARTGDGRAKDPYFLYRSSNLGSFAALIAYPLLIEPLIGLDAQARLWTCGYAMLMIVVTACALCARAPLQSAATAAPTRSQVRASDRLAWIGLSAVPSGLLVAATSHISIDVAAIPLIWVLPLALYLLSFVVAYRQVGAWPQPALAAIQVAGTSFAFLWIVLGSPTLLLDLSATLGLLFVNALIAHRAVYEKRPASDRLTEFYLCTSLGGVLGGIFAALIAPHIFSGTYEYPILLALALACRPGALAGSLAACIDEGKKVLAVLGIVTCFAGAAALISFSGYLQSIHHQALSLATFLIGLLFAFGVSWRLPSRAALFGASAGLASIVLPAILASDTHQVRSFFGLHKVIPSGDGHFRLLAHGTTVHGAMRIRNDDGTEVSGPPEAASYYWKGGGLVEAIDLVRSARGTLPAVSVVGLGAGGLACQERAGEKWSFFEIDPAVIEIAKDPRYFRFLSECAPDAAIVQGDARLTLARRPNATKLLVVDAFSSDAIPIHLLTREALDIDLAHLEPEGVLVFHISNRHFELRNVLARLAADRGLTLLHRTTMIDPADANKWRLASHVVMLTRDPGIESAALAQGWVRVAPDPTRRPWTDDFANALEAMIDRWRSPVTAMAPAAH